MPGSMLGGRMCITGADSTKRAGPKKFAEPVSLSSTASADLPLPGTAFGLGFDLLALRARRKQHTNVSRWPVKGSKKGVSAICGISIFTISTAFLPTCGNACGKESAPSEQSPRGRHQRVGHALDEPNA